MHLPSLVHTKAKPFPKSFTYELASYPPFHHKVSALPSSYFLFLSHYWSQLPSTSPTRACTPLQTILCPGFLPPDPFFSFCLFHYSGEDGGCVMQSDTTGSSEWQGLKRPCKVWKTQEVQRQDKHGKPVFVAVVYRHRQGCSSVLPMMHRQGGCKVGITRVVNNNTILVMVGITRCNPYTVDGTSPCLSFSFFFRSLSLLLRFGLLMLALYIIQEWIVSNYSSLPDRVLQNSNIFRNLT